MKILFLLTSFLKCRRLAGALAVRALLVSALHAQSTIFNDTFADGERLTQNLPNSVAWHVSTTRAGAMTVRNGALDVAVADNGSTVWSYFPKVSLRVGESITLSMDFSVTSLPGGNGASFRSGLCHTNGVPPRLADGARPEGNYQGYAINTHSGKRATLYKRNGPAAPISSMIGGGFLMSDPADLIWTPLSSAQINAISQVNVAYTVTLSVTRTASDAAMIEQSISGGGLPSTNRLSVSDPSNIFFDFDTVGIYFPDDSFGDLIITRVTLTTRSFAAITNLSILTNITAADPLFTVGTVIGGAGTNGSKALLIRAAGPSLTALGVNGALADPKLDVFSGQTVTASNDNWGGTAALNAAFVRVGAFGYGSATSRDAAVFNPALAAGGYTVQVSGVGGVTGAVIAELYDSTPASEFTATTPRHARGGVHECRSVSLVDTREQDAALLVVLAPGNYTAQVSGVAGSAGLALVEVYEVP